MPRSDPSAELRDHARFMLGKYRQDAAGKVEERIAALTTLGQRGMITDWQAIGEEIANLLRTPHG